MLFIVCTAQAQQNPTLNKDQGVKETSAAHKVMVIPFEPRLYMSEIDRQINAETKLSAREIRHKFRDGLNEQISKALKASRFGVLDLMDDTLKYKKDLFSIYQYVAYDYVKVPDQNRYRVPLREKENRKIEKGQVVVETNSDARFMDARMTDPKQLQALSQKYRTDLFLFINQLDLKAAGSKDPQELGEGSESRKIVVHYTILDASGKELNSGIVEELFDPALNIPRKIIDKHFSKVAIALQTRLQKTLNPVR